MATAPSHELPLLAPIRPVAVVVLLLDDSVDQDGHGKDIDANGAPDIPAKRISLRTPNAMVAGCWMSQQCHELI